MNVSKTDRFGGRPDLGSVVGGGQSVDVSDHDCPNCDNRLDEAAYTTSDPAAHAIGRCGSCGMDYAVLEDGR